MKVKCIRNSGYHYEFCLTKGKIYNVIEEYLLSGRYLINNDNNNSDSYPINHFRLLSKSEERNEKIDKLLGE